MSTAFAWCEPAPATGGRCERDVLGGRASDILVRLAVALWFLLQAGNFVRAIASDGVAVGRARGSMPRARRGSGRKICLFFFFTMMAG